MSAYVPEKLRQLVGRRAAWRCEYRRLPQHAARHKHEPDHILPRQHGGATEARNLALICWRCNRHKGPNVGSYDPATGVLTPFYNPRAQIWEEHFRLEGALIQPLTAEGRVTVRIFGFNDAARVEEREEWLRLGLY